MLNMRTTDRKSVRLRFIGLYLLSIGCMVLIGTAVYRSATHQKPETVYIREPAAPQAAPQQPQPVSNGVSFARLSQLEEQYALQLADGSPKEERYRQLQATDSRLSAFLDSLENAGGSEALTETVAFGRKVLSVHRLAAAQLSATPVATQADAALDDLRTALKEKDRRIAQLTEAARRAPATSRAETVKYEYKPAKGESIEALKQSNVNLQLGFKDVMNKLWESYRSYNLLKKENEQLRRQLAQSGH